jgi:MFS family permease
MVYPKFRWFVLFSLVIITASGTMTMIAPSPLVPTIHKDLGITLGQTTAITMMVVMASTCIVAILSGFVIDKIGFALTWIIGLSIQIIASLLINPLSSTVGGLILGRALQGMGMGPINAVIAAVCAQWFKYNERTFVAAVQGVSVWLGISLGLLYTPHMYEFFGNNWHRALAMSAVPPAVGMIFALIIFFGPKPPVRLIQETEDAQKIHKRDFKLSLGTSAIWVLFIMALFEAWYQQAFNDMAPGFYAADMPVGLGLGAVGAGLKLTWAGYASILGTILAPFLVEKVFKGKPKVPLSISCIIGAGLVLGMLALTNNSGIWLILLPCGMLFFTSIVNPTIYGYIAKHYPDSVVGRLGGTATGLAAGGSVLGLAAGSTALHLTGFYTISNIILAIVIFIAGTAAAFLRQPEIKPAEEYLR